MLETIYYAAFNFLAHYGFTIALLVGIIGGIAGHIHWRRSRASEVERAHLFGLEIERATSRQEAQSRAADRSDWKKLKQMGL